ncbi:hypothetical protein F5Y00DRAFT_235274 [Daldinia vernicosa]|uniref:uncharacterized protein n=1 Tax=Daldinia vernicosa TaxID=114800 RepID=UPI0020087CFB|nr:uncharacterized protein F5Y00DRAFT_235274 [Daldinia vernicosa]KAI0849616.1 hypothetical protein F5Y00DRAFT_235274 [Daldinia vernicosa]
MSGVERIHRYLARTMDIRDPEGFDWWEDRLIPILDTSNIHNPKQLNDLLKRYVPTMKSVKKLPANTAFVALDIKPKFGIGGLFDVSLALLSKLEEHNCARHEERLCLADFITEHQVKVTSFRVNMIGRREVVNPRATATIVRAMRKLCEEVPGQNIALIGFSPPKDIECIGLNFAHIIEMFPYWIDLSRMIGAASPALAYHQMDMRTILRAFGYSSIDTVWIVGIRIVVNEAVRALAVLHGLQCREGVERLVLGERKFPDIKIEARVEAFRFMPYKALIHNQGLPLPPSIDSAQKLALATEDCQPFGVAADICDVRFEGNKPRCPGIHATRMTRGCVCFNDERTLEEFINNVDGSIIDGVTIKVERIPYQPLWKYLKEAIKARGISLYAWLAMAATTTKENLPRWYDALSSPTEGILPWCPNPEDAPPGFYDTDDDSTTYFGRLRG